MRVTMSAYWGLLILSHCVIKRTMLRQSLFLTASVGESTASKSMTISPTQYCFQRWGSGLDWRMKIEFNEIVATIKIF